MAAAFERYIGIDYSGAGRPDAPQKGLRVFSADRDHTPLEQEPPKRSSWTRQGIAEWLETALSSGLPTIVGIDHAFSFPGEYFERHGIERDWARFLDDFCEHWPTDRESVEAVRKGSDGRGCDRMGEASWRRATDRAAGAAKGVFHFDVQGSVAKSTFAGLPWLRRLREQVQPGPHFWPFDGWHIAPGRSAIVEVYPRLWNRRPTPVGWTSDQHDAFVVAAWMRDADASGDLAVVLEGPEALPERTAAAVEGWILGAGVAAPTWQGPDGLEVFRLDDVSVEMIYLADLEPHVQARMGRHCASIEVESGFIRGEFPGDELVRLHAWVKGRREELLANWELARRGRPLRQV
jgi:hypothetical protein